MEDENDEVPPNKMAKTPIYMASEYWMEIGAWMDQIELKDHLRPTNGLVTGFKIAKTKFILF